MNKNDGGPAFPRPHQVINAKAKFFKEGARGMSLRAYAAAKFMAAFASSGMTFNDIPEPKIANYARVAVRYADALIEELEKEGT